MSSRRETIEELRALVEATFSAPAATHTASWLDVDLSVAQLKALFVLDYAGASRVGGVAKALGLSANATTAVLDRLESFDLVTRRSDPADRRAVLVSLTDEGTQRVSDLNAARLQDFTELLDDLSSDELHALQVGFGALSRAIQVRRVRDEAASPTPRA